MENTFDQLREEVQDTVRQELEMFYRMSGVFIQMLMHEAESQNSTLRADVNYMENYKALEDIKDFEKLQLKGNFSLQKKATITSKLPTLGAHVADPNMQNELANLRLENELLKKQVRELQAKITQVLSSKSQVSDEVDSHTKQKDHEIAELESQILNLQVESNKAKDQADNLRQELINTKDEMKKKLNQTTQVTNMKKMIQEKNAKIKQLREKLSKYESVDDDEDS